MKKKCYEEFLQGNEYIKDLYIKFHNLKKRKHFKEIEKMNLKKELEKLLILEDQAINKNDFDEAQNIENKIIEIKKFLAELASQGDDFNVEIINLREEELQAISNKSEILEGTCMKLLTLKAKIEKDIDIFNNSQLAKHKNDNIKIKKLAEKLQFLKTDIEEKKAYIDEEEGKINQVIKSQSADIFEELDVLKNSKYDILEEIHKLEQLLEQKYSQLDKIDKQIESKDGEIEAIKSTYSHEFNKINIKKVNYEDKLKDYNDQNLILDEMKNCFNQNQINIDKQINEMSCFIKDIEGEISEMKNNILNVEHEFIKRKNLLKDEKEIELKINNIESTINALIQKKTEESNQINNLTGAIKKLETELVSCEIRIPSLEEEKKSYVVAKNFKEAGRVSNELKALNETKIKNQSIIQAHQGLILELKKQIKIIDSDLTLKEKESCDIYIESNITRYEYLLCYQKQIQDFIQEYKAKAEIGENLKKARDNLMILNEEVVENRYFL